MTAYVYVTCLERELGDRSRACAFAKHYVGSAMDWQARQEEHRAGLGAKMLAAANERGIGYRVTRVYTCPDFSTARQVERLLKARSHYRKLCPCCQGKTNSTTPVITEVQDIDDFRPRKPIADIIERHQQRINRRAAERRGGAHPELSSVELLSEAAARAQGIPIRTLDLRASRGSYPLEWECGEQRSILVN